MRIRLSRSRWAAWLVVLLCSACRTPYAKRVDLPKGLAVSAVAVYPFGFRWGEKPYRAFELSQRVVRQGLQVAADRALFFGPSEFHTYRAEDDNVWAATDLLARLPEYSLPAERVVVFRPWAEKRIHSGQGVAYGASGRAAAVQQQHETTYVGHVEVVHPSSQRVIAELSGQVVVDPFAVRAEDESDPEARLTELMESLTREALEVIAPSLTPPGSPRELGFTYAFNPIEAMRYSDGSQPPFELELAKMDALESEMFRTERVRIANPGISDAEATKLVTLPGGLVVLSSGAESNLRAGEVIVALSGRPALPQSLHRARFLAAPPTARVRRVSGEEIELAVPK